MRHFILCLTTALLILCSCSNGNNLNMSETEVDYEGLCTYDSLTEGYISWVIETAVDNHINNYLGFEKEQFFLIHYF